MSDPAPADPLAAFVRPLVWDRHSGFWVANAGRAYFEVYKGENGHHWRALGSGIDASDTAPTGDAARAAAEAEHARMALEEAGRWLDMEAVRAAIALVPAQAPSAPLRGEPFPG